MNGGGYHVRRVRPDAQGKRPVGFLAPEPRVDPAGADLAITPA